MNDFPAWLRAELDRRGMKQADLARAANLDSAVVSNIVNGRRGLGESTCRAIAKGLSLPVEIVFRAAGMLPPETDMTETRERINFMLDGLPDFEQKNAMRYIEFLYEQWHRDD